MGYIGAHGIAALHKYKYSGEDHSYLAKYPPCQLLPTMDAANFFHFFSFALNFIVLFIACFSDRFLHCIICFSSFSNDILLALMYLNLYMFMHASCSTKHGMQCLLLQIAIFIEHIGTPRVHMHVLLTNLHLMPSMGNKPEEQTPLVHLENFLIMVASTFITTNSDRTIISWRTRNIYRVRCARMCAKLKYLNIIMGSKNPQNYKIDSYLQLVIMAVGSTAICERDTFWFWVISAIPFYEATWEQCPVVGSEIWEIHSFVQLGTFHQRQAFCRSNYLFTLFVCLALEIPTYRATLYLMTVFGVIPTVACDIGNVHKVIQAKKGSMLLALAMLHPFILLIGGLLVWDYLSPSDIILGAGLAFGFLVGRMILAHLCDESKGLTTNMCMPLLYLPLAIANALTARRIEGVPLVDEFWVVLGYCVFTVTHEITTALGIYCFSSPRHEIEKHWYCGKFLSNPQSSVIHIFLSLASTE
ncbi:hypothetical protein CXB51_010513 [Gossypium anomalum]|uniref:Uncharacterized protein n=1 Tax=Gossypium anomalum TaxID=47600 RepID=A0A8J5Z7F2_9ROSI|nr:hypothetical protein CXB51_010513 [Gossypium anomalum]